MPIILTFEVTDDDNNQRNRVQDFLVGFGWQNLGGSAYRYPPLNHAGAEDWLNHVIPALMLFRRYLLSSERIKIKNVTIDTHASSGYDRDSGFGHRPRVLASGDLAAMPYEKFTRENLLTWINNADYPYP
jgi:hypothetical protein